MDAYTSYILRLSEARVSELRREAEERAISRAARAARRQGQVRRWWDERRRRSAPDLPVTLPMPQIETELRRSA